MKPATGHVEGKIQNLEKQKQKKNKFQEKHDISKLITTTTKSLK